MALQLGNPENLLKLPQASIFDPKLEILPTKPSQYIPAPNKQVPSLNNPCSLKTFIDLEAHYRTLNNRIGSTLTPKL